MYKVSFSVLILMTISFLTSCNVDTDEIKSYQDIDLNEESTFYWWAGESRELLINQNELYIVFRTGSNISKSVQWIVEPRPASNVSNIEESNLYMEAFIPEGELSKITNVYYKSRVVTKIGVDYMQNVGVSIFCCVKLKSSTSVSWLRTVASEYYLEDVQKYSTLPRWYSFKCTNKTPFDALEILNILYETGKVEKVQPFFIQKDNAIISPLD